MTFQERVKLVREEHEKLLNRKNVLQDKGNGIYERYLYPIITAEHIPLEWRYDFCEKDNPYFMQRIMMNATLNSGAIKLNGKYLLVVRVEGADRKSFFAVAESPNGIDNFRFWDEPITMPEDVVPATNIYDMRLTQHEDGWIYGLFCVERHDDLQPDNLSAATATCGIARTKDLKTWERLPDLMAKCQQRNVCLHPEFVNGKYALYTRPQDGFIDAGSGGGIGWALVDDIANAEVKEEKIINARRYHTIMEVKNGEGPHPIKTPEGWLHLAHGVRGCASGLRYVLYMYMTSLEDPTQIVAQPGGYFLAPQEKEYVGDVMNVVFSNGWIADGEPADGLHSGDERVLIYYASSDTRMHVAVSTIARLIDYCKNTPADGFATGQSVAAIKALVNKNNGIPPLSHQGGMKVISSLPLEGVRMGLQTLNFEIQDVLHNNILNFWLKMQDKENGGFYGQMRGDGTLVKNANKGGILNARILWTFSSAYRVTRRQEYLDAATVAKDYILEHFVDTEYGGTYWELDCKGNPIDTKKQFYALGFMVYGFSEYYRATGDEASLGMALSLYDDIEAHSFDKAYDGYIEACTREFGEIADMRLSDLDANYPKSQNTHLHIMEPYTNLYRALTERPIARYDDYKKRIEASLRNLIDIFCNIILNPKTHHLDLFFKMDWTRGVNGVESYGHDIECSWLLHEAALVIGDKELIAKVEPIVRIVASASEEGLNADGSMTHEANLGTGYVDADRHWWVQAETVVGFLNIYQHFNDEKALAVALRCWEYIKHNLVDEKLGEWYWSRDPERNINRTDDHAGFWKCPYHNSRMCLELIERINSLLS